MTSFDVLYPFDKDEIEFEGSYLMRGKMPEHCWHCGNYTMWVDLNFMAHLCSEECERAKWKEYFDSYKESAPR